MVSKSLWGPLVTAGGAHKYSFGKTFTSLFASTNHHADQLASARPLSYGRLRRFSCSTGITTAPNHIALRLSLNSTATTEADDQKVSYMIHDPCPGDSMEFCLRKRTAREIEQQLQRRGSRRYTNWPSTVEAGALQIGPSSPRKAGDQQIGPGYT